MAPEDFKRNLKGCNKSEDFDGEMLEEIYWSIHKEEIVMPEEHAGVLRESYLWKVMLLRSAMKEGQFTHAPSGIYDHSLFSLIWGSTVAAISFVFDKTVEDSLIQKLLTGFRKCAAIAAHYSMCDVFDNLVISLCKFSTIMNYCPKSKISSTKKNTLQILGL